MLLAGSLACREPKKKTPEVAGVAQDTMLLRDPGGGKQEHRCRERGGQQLEYSEDERRRIFAGDGGRGGAKSHAGDTHRVATTGAYI